VILKTVSEAGYDRYTRENLPIAEKQRRKSTNGREEKLDGNSVAASGTIFRISKCVKKKQAENVYLFFSLKGQPKNLKIGCACIKSANFIFRGFQKKYSSHDPVPLNI
jgi:hypothetical protein